MAGSEPITGALQVWAQLPEVNRRVVVHWLAVIAARSVTGCRDGPDGSVDRCRS